MEIRKQMLTSAAISVLALVFVILIALFPRHLDISIEKFEMVSNYEFSFSKYADNIKTFFSEAIANKSLGDTIHMGVTVEQTVFASMSKSLDVIITTLFLGFLFGLIKGIVDYKLSKTRFNVLGSWVTWVLQSVPDFLILLLIQWLVIRKLKFIPYFAQGEWYDFILPSIMVSIYPIIYIARITTSSIATQEGQLYIQVARAKGLTERLILYKHILANCLGTILTHLSPLFVYILSNLLMVEYFTNYPGAAYRLFQAIDYNSSFGTGYNYEPGVIIGISFCFMLLILLVQFISQIARKFVSPR